MTTALATHGRRQTPARHLSLVPVTVRLADVRQTRSQAELAALLRDRAYRRYMASIGVTV